MDLQKIDFIDNNELQKSKLDIPNRKTSTVKNSNSVLRNLKPKIGLDESVVMNRNPNPEPVTKMDEPKIKSQLNKPTRTLNYYKIYLK